MIIRINNIECREIKNSKDFELICYRKNIYYGKEDVMKTEGWIFNSEGDAHKGCTTVHSSCFENEFTIYIIGYIRFNHAGDEFDVHSVGCRLFDLNPEDYIDFKDVLIEIGKQITRE